MSEKLTHEQWQTAEQVEQSIESLTEWLQKCLDESDGELREILTVKIQKLHRRLERMIN